ncbi:type II toxin-antitoxin system RelE/ParE family toxin [Argonema antarcticum]|uniref:type II toxin-antitoxin system RelE/ParE family toxin n=1 Tax=Argonema antarcticum TaxID=2942763 RepID=UPI002012C753|nr:type II toxin-antitoxin system RelE/ParE family toxin [Argonema antarcticum]MCL1471068.1 type II toxin-antitoxin system RelE/ParE family toxin [Argonema antarcticum A004/B2]
MTIKIIVKPKATLDLKNAFDYIAEDNFDIALRFFDSARQTFAQLSLMPGMGKIYKTELRKWPIKDFKKYFIFYRANDEFIEVVRVIHSAQDIEAILEENDNPA